MYGTIYRCRPKPGHERVVDELNERWLRERAPAVSGFFVQYVLRSESSPGVLFGLCIFDSERNYRKNAADPEQQHWHEQFRAALTEDPEWNDGEIVALEPASVPL